MHVCDQLYRRRLSGLGQLAEQWNGSAWKIMTLTELPDADLGGISCTQATSCTAVGTQLVSGTTSSAWRTLAEHWNGTTWAIEKTPNPGGGDQTTFDAVSCTQTSFCVAAGSDANQSGQTQYAFSATWNGSTWTAENTPYRTGTNGDYLTGISCFSTVNCIAAGNTQTVNAQYATLIDQWNGSSWTTLPSPAVPAGAAYFQVRSSSCASTTACAAVGGYNTPQRLSTAFIMQTSGGG